MGWHWLLFQWHCVSVVTSVKQHNIQKISDWIPNVSFPLQSACKIPDKCFDWPILQPSPAQFPQHGDKVLFQGVDHRQGTSSPRWGHLAWYGSRRLVAKECALVSNRSISNWAGVLWLRKQRWDFSESKSVGSTLFFFFLFGQHQISYTLIPAP